MGIASAVWTTRGCPPQYALFVTLGREDVGHKSQAPSIQRAPCPDAMRRHHGRGKAPSALRGPTRGRGPESDLDPFGLAVSEMTVPCLHTPRAMNWMDIVPLCAQPFVYGSKRPACAHEFFRAPSSCIWRHGYPPASFGWSPLPTKRNDEYGVPARRLMRFPLEGRAHTLAAVPRGRSARRPHHRTTRLAATAG